MNEALVCFNYYYLRMQYFSYISMQYLSIFEVNILCIYMLHVYIHIRYQKLLKIDKDSNSYTSYMYWAVLCTPLKSEHFKIICSAPVGRSVWGTNVAYYTSYDLLHGVTESYFMWIPIGF